MNPAAPSFRLDGKRALVTGAGRGIGLAIARAFAHAGAEATLCSRTEGDLDGAIQQLRTQGLSANRLVADVTDVPAFSAQIDALPAFDVVVNNAGGNRPSSSPIRTTRRTRRERSRHMIQLMALPPARQPAGAAAD